MASEISSSQGGGARLAFLYTSVCKCPPPTEHSRFLDNVSNWAAGRGDDHQAAELQIIRLGSVTSCEDVDGVSLKQSHLIRLHLKEHYVVLEKKFRLLMR